MLSLRVQRLCGRGARLRTCERPKPLAALPLQGAEAGTSHARARSATSDSSRRDCSAGPSELQMLRDNADAHGPCAVAKPQARAKQAGIVIQGGQ